MKALRACIVLGLLLTTGVAYGMHVKTDYDRSFDFGKLRTFAFKDQDRPGGSLLRENTLVDKRIRDALRRDLEARGFRYAPDGGADFLVAYYARQREKVEVENVGYGLPHRWRWGWGPNVWTSYYTEGSVVVDLVDPVDNQLIWRGRVTDTVKGLEQSDKQINKGVDELVKHFVKDEKKYS
jgi:Domain of unknown function (DUF4136)